MDSREDRFSSPVVFQLMLSRKRGEPMLHQFTLSLKESPNPSVFESEGEQHTVMLKTPFLPVKNYDLSVWMRRELTRS